MPLYPNLYADIIFNYTDLRSGLECSHPHNILQLGCAPLEDSSYAEYWCRQKTQGPPSSVMVRQGPFLLTSTHWDKQRSQQRHERHVLINKTKAYSQHLDWHRSTMINLEFILAPAHKTFPHICFHFAIFIATCDM
jgi:hypothetical protein